MKSKCLFLLAAVGVSFALQADPKTYYVDSKLDDYTGHDGSSWEKAFETIQEAINKAAASGDKIFVASGVYEGGQTFSSWGKARLSIVDKSIWIEGAGADRTIVRGKWGSDEYGLGTDTNDCARCVQLSGTACKGTVLKGMTFCDGATTQTLDDPLGGKYADPANKGSGIYAEDGLNREVFVVDCIVSNCHDEGSHGVVRGVTFVRSKIVSNHQIGPASSPKLCYGCNFLNCLVAHNSAWKNGDMCHGGMKAVNCTFIDNRFSTQCASTSTGYFYNSITAGYKLSAHTSPRIAAEHLGGDVFGHEVYTNVLMSLWTDDVRIREESGCPKLGDAQYLTDTSLIPALPEGIERMVDLWGNALPESGSIWPGAVQESVASTLGCITSPMSVDGDYFTIDGVEHYQGTYHYSTVPTQYVYRSSNETPSSRLVRLYTTTTFGRMTSLFPQRDGSVIVTTPPAGQTLVLNTKNNSSSVVYADPAADPATADGSYEHPYATLKDAVEGATGAYRLIYAKPGVYSNGVMTSTFSNTSGLKCRVFCPKDVEINIVSLEGPEKTMIVGAPDPETKGCGKDAVRIGIGNALRFIGFTLTGAYTQLKEGDFADVKYADRASVLMSEGAQSGLRECIVTNNYGGALGPLSWIWADRCLIRDNHASGGSILAGCYLISSVVGRNSCGASGYIYGGEMTQNWVLNCTVVGKGDDTLYENNALYRKNSIFANAASVPNPLTSDHSIYWAIGTVPDALGPSVKDPLFMDVETGDYRLFSKSEALRAATFPADYNCWMLLSRDYEGDLYRFDADGVYAAGAFQKPVSARGVYISDGKSVGGVQHGFVATDPGQDATVTLIAGAKRPIGTYVLNGATNAFTSASVTIPAAALASGAVFDPVCTDRWYVDCTNGSDTAGFGYNPACAFKTIARALTNATLKTGDTVALMPGVYEEGKMWQDATHVIPSRAVVRNGTTLEAEGTAAETIIRGLASDDEDAPTSATYKPYTAGLGKNAIRCVWTESGAVVRGLTLENGHTRGFNDDGGANHSDADYNGGNAFGQGRLERCVLRGGKAFRGGGAMSANCYDCVFTGNESLYGGGATSDARMYGCLSYGNTCWTAAERHGFFYYVACENCTIADADGGPSNLKYALKNTLITGSCKKWVSTGGAPGPTNFVNCAIDTDKTTYQTAIAAGVGCILTNAASLQVDADYRPVVGANVAIDAGDAAISPNIGDTDLSGGQRVYNGALDIGALEGDWRATYAKDLAGSRATVKAASSNVVESLTKTVILNPEAKLEATLAGSKDGRETDYGIKAKITGNGQLIAKLNGEVLGEPLQGPCDDVMELKFTNAHAENELSFEYVPGADDTGSAEILKMRRYVGTLLLVR